MSPFLEQLLHKWQAQCLHYSYRINAIIALCAYQFQLKLSTAEPEVCPHGVSSVRSKRPSELVSIHLPLSTSAISELSNIEFATSSWPCQGKQCLAPGFLHASPTLPPIRLEQSGLLDCCAMSRFDNQVHTIDRRSIDFREKSVRRSRNLKF